MTYADALAQVIREGALPRPDSVWNVESGGKLRQERPWSLFGSEKVHKKGVKGFYRGGKGKGKGLHSRPCRFGAVWDAALGAYVVSFDEELELREPIAAHANAWLAVARAAAMELPFLQVEVEVVTP